MIANEKTVPPNSLLCDIVHCLEQLREICDEIVADIDTLLVSSYVDDLDDLVPNKLNNQVFEYAYKDGSERLKKMSLHIKKKIHQFQKKNYLNSKKNFPPTKKNFLNFIKRIIYLTTKIFFYLLAYLYND